MVHLNVPAKTHTVRRLNFSDGFHWCERCAESAIREPATYFIMTLERVEAKTEKVVSDDV